MNGNRHDLPSSPVGLLHTGYDSIALSHRGLAYDLDLDGSAYALPKGAREGPDRLDRAALAADDPACVLLGARDLDERAALAIGHVKGDG